MQKQTVFDKEYASLYYYPEHKIVHHVFHKFIYGDEFRQVLDKGIELFQQYGANKWLSDDRSNSALPTDDLTWGLEDWAPRVFKAGWKYWAILMPDKVAGQMSMNRIMKRYIDQGLVMQVFSDTDEALQWLESV
jgi:hypothetical protein